MRRSKVADVVKGCSSDKVVQTLNLGDTSGCHGLRKTDIGVTSTH